MSRDIADRNILDDFCIAFCSVLENHCKYIVVSGFVAIASGRTRGTEDIDVIVEKIDKDAFVALHDDLVHNDFECMQGDNPIELYEEYLVDNTSIRYTYKDKLLPEMEFKLAKDELDEYQIKTRQKIPLTGLDIWFSSISMNIAFKEELLTSDKDLEDARHLRIIYENEIDEDEITKIKSMIQEFRL